MREQLTKRTNSYFVKIANEKKTKSSVSINFDAFHTLRFGTGEKMPLSTHWLWTGSRTAFLSDPRDDPSAIAIGFRWSARKPRAAGLSVRYGVSGDSSTSYNLLYRLRR